MSRNTRGRVLRNILILLVVVVVVFGLRFRQLGRGEALADIRSIQRTEGVPVETVVAEIGDLSDWITLAGTVEGEVQYAVVSNNALQVIDIPVREGQRVEAGDVVIRLAAATPTPMYHSLDKSRANYEKALLDVQRLRNLLAEGAIAQAELDAAETRLKVQAADLGDAEGTTTLRADRAGFVSSILVVEGETVDTKKPLAWIVDNDTVVLRFAAGSAQALALAAGQTARWILPDGGDGGVGEIGRLDLMADPLTHLLAGEARFPNPDGRLVPGLLVTFRVRTRGADDVVLLPADCLVEGPDGPSVWVVDPSLHAELRPVTKGLATVDRVEIAAGLRAGESVVRHGQALLAAGVLVRRVGAGEDS
jgi:membrane fusion protein (multidrug efflux system)